MEMERFTNIYGEIIVIRQLDPKIYVWNGERKLRRIAEFKCHCGKTFKGDYQNAKHGKLKSCGCSHKRRSEFFDNSNKRHGMCGTKLYNVYKGIKNRCSNTANSHHKYYGLRGIKCEWDNFQDFYKDMSIGYKEGLDIDRIDVNGNYCKENCRWATKKENANNTRRNVYIQKDGVTKTMSQWCEELGISYTMVRRRIQKGWDKTLAITTDPLR